MRFHVAVGGTRPNLHSVPRLVCFLFSVFRFFFFFLRGNNPIIHARLNLLSVVDNILSVSLFYSA